MIYNAGGGAGAAGAGETKVPIAAQCGYVASDDSSSYKTVISGNGKGYIDGYICSKVVTGYLTLIIDGVTLINGKQLRDVCVDYCDTYNKWPIRIRFNKSFSIKVKAYNSTSAMYFGGVAYFEE